MKTIIILSLSLLTACGGSEETATETADTNTNTNTNTTTTTTQTTDTTHEPSPCKGVLATATLSGLVLDTNGDPFEGASVNLCHDACRVANTGADGVYLFENVQNCPQSLDVPNGGDTYATPITILDFGDNEVREVTITMVEHGGWMSTPTSSAEIEIATGLFVTVGVDDLSLLFGDVDQLAGATVSEAHYLPVDVPGEIIAMYHLEPFDAEAAPSMPVKVANTFGLKDGETVDVWTASYHKFEWINGGTLTASGDWLEGDAALEVISTTALIKPLNK
jgi:hypothetical protein